MLSTVREGNVTFVLVVNITRGPARVKDGVYLGDGLVYDQKLLLTDLNFPTACVGVVKFSADIQVGRS